MCLSFKFSIHCCLSDLEFLKKVRIMVPRPPLLSPAELEGRKGNYRDTNSEKNLQDKSFPGMKKLRAECS
jgi:hypothetical protein